MQLFLIINHNNLLRISNLFNLFLMKEIFQILIKYQH